MFVLFATLVACENYAPSATILSPEDNAEIGAGSPVLFQARISDPESPVGYLITSWTSDVDGDLSGIKGFEADVMSLLVSDMSAGAHTVTLEVTDPNGNSVKRQVSFSIAANTAPIFTWSSPEDGSLVGANRIPVNLTVSDPDETSMRQITLAWSGSAIQDDAELPDRPTEDGLVTGTLGDVPAGDWDLTVTATDPLGGTASSTLTFATVEVDGDGDRYETTELGGEDCDDTDPDIHPNASEHCDGVDEDCDGDIDESPVDAEAWYFDADGDGYGYSWDYIESCDDPGVDYASEYGDCNDYDDEQAPNLEEVCDGKDNDCDGDTDEAPECD